MLIRDAWTGMNIGLELQPLQVPLSGESSLVHLLQVLNSCQEVIEMAEWLRAQRID